MNNQEQSPKRSAMQVCASIMAKAIVNSPILDLPNTQDQLAAAIGYQFQLPKDIVSMVVQKCDSERDPWSPQSSSSSSPMCMYSAKAWNEKSLDEPPRCDSRATHIVGNGKLNCCSRHASYFPGATQDLIIEETIIPENGSGYTIKRYRQEIHRDHYRALPMMVSPFRILSKRKIVEIEEEQLWDLNESDE